MVESIPNSILKILMGESNNNLNIKSSKYVMLKKNWNYESWFCWRWVDTYWIADLKNLSGLEAIFDPAVPGWTGNWNMWKWRKNTWVHQNTYK